MERYFFLNIFPIIFGIGALWNLLIIIYFIKINIKKLTKMSAYHFLILNLALADFLVCVTASIIRPSTYKASWDLVVFGCIILSTLLENVYPMVSCYMLVLISYARYRSIVHPLRVKLNKKQYGSICCIIWVISFLANIYFFTSMKLTESDEGHLDCGTGANSIQLIAQISINYIIDGLIPLGIMVYFYLQMKAQMNAEENGNTFVLNGQSRHRNKTVLRTIRGLILIFSLTVIPARIGDIVLTMVLYYAVKSRPSFYQYSNPYFCL